MRKRKKKPEVPFPYPGPDAWGVHRNWTDFENTTLLLTGAIAGMTPW